MEGVGGRKTGEGKGSGVCLTVLDWATRAKCDAVLFCLPRNCVGQCVRRAMVAGGVRGGLMRRRGRDGMGDSREKSREAEAHVYSEVTKEVGHDPAQ